MICVGATLSSTGETHYVMVLHLVQLVKLIMCWCYT